MFVLVEKDSHLYLSKIVDAHEANGGVLEIATPNDEGVSDLMELPGYTMADLVTSMNAASRAGDCVATLRSTRPRSP